MNAATIVVPTDTASTFSKLFKQKDRRTLNAYFNDTTTNFTTWSEAEAHMNRKLISILVVRNILDFTGKW